MPKYAIHNTISSDGLGDFTHFDDILNALLANHAFNGVEFIAIVTCQNDHAYLDIKARLSALGITFLYRKNEEPYITNSNETIETIVSEIDQAIIISIGCEEDYSYLKKNAPIKFIGEHEITDSIFGYTSRSLGLSTGCYGIKLQNITPMQPKTAWTIIQEHDAVFATQLLLHTQSDRFEMLNNNYVLIPAYFNNEESFVIFLNFLGVNHSCTNGKNIVIYQSGFNFMVDDDNAFKHFRTDQYNYTNIERIELFRPGNNPLIKTCNPPAKDLLVIKIFAGFRVSGFSYDALYQLSKVAGISGDNTLERCISMDILPLYRSTHHNSSKYKTLEALQEITQLHQLTISLEARQSYNILFNPHFFDDFRMECQRINSVNPTRTRNTQPMNIQAMIEDWPIVTNYLKKNKNFYDNLAWILVEKLPVPRQTWPTFMSSAIVSKAHDTWVSCREFNRACTRLTLSSAVSWAWLLQAMLAVLATIHALVSRNVPSMWQTNPCGLFYLDIGQKHMKKASCPSVHDNGFMSIEKG